MPTLRIESERDENIVTFRQTHRRLLRAPFRQQLLFEQKQLRNYDVEKYGLFVSNGDGWY